MVQEGVCTSVEDEKSLVSIVASEQDSLEAIARIARAVDMVQSLFTGIRGWREVASS